MKTTLLVIGKTDKDFVIKGIEEYQKRLVHYMPYEMKIIPDIKNTKNLSEQQQKQKEGELILKKLHSSDHVVLLDEKGKEYRSIDFAKYLQKKMNSGMKQLVFVIGGPYGFGNEIYKRASEKIAFSKMTFSHQMIRLFAVEQLYRGFTILKKEPYHHE